VLFRLVQERGKGKRRRGLRDQHMWTIARVVSRRFLPRPNVMARCQELLGAPPSRGKQGLRRRALPDPQPCLEHGPRSRDDLGSHSRWGARHSVGLRCDRARCRWGGAGVAVGEWGSGRWGLLLESRVQKVEGVWRWGFTSMADNKDSMGRAGGGREMVCHRPAFLWKL